MNSVEATVHFSVVVGASTEEVEEYAICDDKRYILEFMDFTINPMDVRLRENHQITVLERRLLKLYICKIAVYRIIIIMQ